MLKFYEYASCSTCRKARQWLDAQGVAYERLPIRETPPSPDELQTMLDAHGGEIKRLVNTSSADYRTTGLKDDLPGLSSKEVFNRLQETGNLVKRPFLIGDGVALVGFKEDDWAAAFKT
ncbi:Spx/MgsR family RNA polymerase-binding regulatory protein [Cerasicoccus arenae]|uniref:ArsC family transcriptional regulator n=1 Tax=Cerasicoccus arenae TaxID=424488 RepID=A0A8J3GD60_9BACT|nr:Spx/MgsR family RNA polymerase-binding regulatory protein [Cerasicoccus arenae]MBK1858834.1 Spx/MgsR family RNA polymerase-binding regulatory protein [Cerasicoccus arenae]GHC04320.1 ArsC family transcriptional regulator [Cerasicoccus arenae]